MKQSAVSRRIQALEDELGVSLFERQSNGVRPTIAGQRFLERTRSAFAEIDYAIKNAAAAGRGDEGVIRIGVLPSFLSGFLCDVLAEFREAQPGVIFDFLDGSPKKLIARIMARQLDVAFIVSGTPTPGCDSEALWSAGICVALPHRHPLAGCDAIDWELLKDERFVFGREATAAGFDDHAIERVARIGGRLSLATHDVSQDLVMQFVALGFGLSLVSDIVDRNPLSRRRLSSARGRRPSRFLQRGLASRQRQSGAATLSQSGALEVGGAASGLSPQVVGLGLPCAPRAFANSRSLAMNFSNIGAINFEASMGFPDSRESISA